MVADESLKLVLCLIEGLCESLKVFLLTLASLSQVLRLSDEPSVIGDELPDLGLAVLLEGPYSLPKLLSLFLRLTLQLL